MKVARVLLPGLDGTETRIAVMHEDQDRAVDVRASEATRLQASGMSRAAAQAVANVVVPSSLTQALEAGPMFMNALRHASQDPSDSPAFTLEALVFDTPADPPSYRDFMAFEEHFLTGMRNAGLTPNPVLYELPVSYMGNPQALIADGTTMPWPAYSDHMDYELELGIVIGRGGRDITTSDALSHVFGLTVLNDFSARDIQVREMAGGLGPCKGKHFATGLGPWITTLDDVNLNNLRMIARVNGEVWSDSSTSSIMWTVPELVAWASASEPLPVGAVLGTGTVGGGSGVEQGRRLSPGDVIELEIAEIGTLRHVIGLKPNSGYVPQVKKPAVAL